jgi:hypothetical protein
VQTNVAPGSNGDSVYFDTPGTYTVTVDTSSPLSLNILSIGSDATSVTISFVGTSIVVSNLFEVKQGSRLSCTNCNTKILGASLLGGVTSWTNSIHEGVWVIPSRATFQFNSGTFQSAKVDIYGSFTHTGPSSSFFTQSILKIYAGGVLNHFGLGPLYCDTSSQIINNGLYNAQTSPLKNLVMTGSIINGGVLSVSGNGSITVGSLTQNMGAQLNLLNSTLKTTQNMNITNGNMNIGGTIIAPSFYFSSTDGIFKIGTKLTVIGNMTLADSATLYLNLNGTNSIDSLNVTGTLILNSFVLISLGNGYNPTIGDRIPFLSSGIIQSDVQNIYLIGAPFKNAKYQCDGHFGSFQIIFSLGSVNNLGYVCHYLGNKKTLEMNRFEKQQKMMISMTAPQRSGFIGFGFDLNGTISSSVLAVSYQGTIQQWNHNSSILNPSFVIASATTSKTIFGTIPGSASIGPDYFTVSILVPLSYLSSQKRIYYAEIPSLFDGNGTSIGPVLNSSHYFEVYDFSIFKTPTVNCTNFLQPQRAEIYSIPALVIMLCLYVLLFVLCLVFYRFRPLNTRGISPFLTIFFLFLQLLLEVRNYAEVSDAQASLCFYYAFAMYPLQQIVFIMILLYFLRYFSIINLNANKNNMYSQITLGQDVERFQKVKLRILKLFNSTWLTTALVILSYLVLSLIFFIVLAGWRFVCQFDTLLTIKTIHNAELILIYTLTVISLISDMIPNWRLLLTKCKWIDYVFHQDPYWFRAQIVLFVPFMIFSLVIEIYTLATTTTYFDVVSNFQDDIALNTTQAAILLIIDVLFPLIITIMALIVPLCRKKVNTNSLENILNDEESMKLFGEFCKMEFSIENLACYQDIQVFKKTKTDPLTPYFKYFNGANSVMEVNCPRGTCQAIYEQLKSGSYDEHLFDPLEKDVLGNLSDTYSRFSFWDKYVRYLQAKVKQVELIEGEKK